MKITINISLFFTRGIGLMQFGEVASHLQDAANNCEEQEITKCMQIMLEKAIASHSFIHKYLDYGDEDVIFSYDKSIFGGETNQSNLNVNSPSRTFEAKNGHEGINPEEDKVRIRNLEMFYHAIYSRNGVLRKLIANLKKSNRTQFRTNISYLLERVSGLGKYAFVKLKGGVCADL